MDGVWNQTMLGDRERAYGLLQQMDSQDNNEILFNEYYLFQEQGERTLWSITPVGIKFMLYQCMLLIGAFFYYKGKRFGKPVPLYEETERNENEYIDSVATLYRRAGCWDLAVDTYYQYLLRNIYRIDSNERDFLAFWEIEKLPDLEKVKEAYEFMNKKDIKHNERKYIHILTVLEELLEILNKRSEWYWKH